MPKAVKVTVTYDDGKTVELAENVVVIYDGGDNGIDWEPVNMTDDAIYDAVTVVRESEIDGDYETFDYIGDN